MIFDFFSLMKKEKSRINIFPGMKNIIENLSKKYVLAMVSRNDDEILKNKLKRFNILKYFSVIISFKKLESKKSALKKCLKCLKIKSNETCYIADSSRDVR